jgi:ubiquitin carboxyl-terminal hydrolase L5
LLTFTASMDAQTRGVVITSSDWLREAHNALSPPNVISLDGLGLPKTTEDAYHFVVYLPVMGSLYELDGLKSNPVTHGPYPDTGEGWLAKARCVNYDDSNRMSRHVKPFREVIETRISTYPPGAVCFQFLLRVGIVCSCAFKLEFSLLAIRDDPIPSLQSQLSQLQSPGNDTSAEATEILVKLANENSKRDRWAVRLDRVPFWIRY